MDTTMPGLTNQMKRQAFRAAQHQLHTLLRMINLSTIPDIPHLAAALGEVRDRPVKIFAVPLPRGFTGAWIKMGYIDAIYHSSDATDGLREHIDLHEISHVLFGHKTLCIPTDMNAKVTSYGVASPLLDDLQQARNRSCYDTVPELEAELLATLIKQAWRSLVPQQDEWNQVHTLARLEGSLFIERVNTFIRW